MDLFKDHQRARRGTGALLQKAESQFKESVQGVGSKSRFKESIQGVGSRSRLFESALTLLTDVVDGF